jgi:hypothetical protein
VAFSNFRSLQHAPHPHADKMDLPPERIKELMEEEFEDPIIASIAAKLLNVPEYDSDDSQWDTDSDGSEEDDAVAAEAGLEKDDAVAADGAHANAYQDAVGCMWTPEELEDLKKPILVPSKLLAPTQFPFSPFPKKEPSLNKKDGAALQKAKDMFDQYLANAENARPLVELLKPQSSLHAYKAAVGDSEGFSLYRIGRCDEDLKVPECEHVSHITLSDDDIMQGAYHPLIDFQLTPDVGRLFAKHVSVWPGCFAIRRVKNARLTDAEKAARRLPDKVLPTDVVVSQEGYIAYRSGNVIEPTSNQRAYMEWYSQRMKGGQGVGEEWDHPPTYPRFLHKDEVEKERLAKEKYSYVRTAKRKRDESQDDFFARTNAEFNEDYLARTNAEDEDE